MLLAERREVNERLIRNIQGLAQWVSSVCPQVLTRA
jgi:hypothetical protein